MTGSEINKKFELLVDDSTELSDAEELDLQNEKYLEVCDYTDWEFLKKQASGSVSGTQISLPSDFSHILEDTNYTESYLQTYGAESGKRVKVGSIYYNLVNWSDRKQYENNNTCYLDMVNNTLVFSVSVSGAYSFDYKFIPSLLTTTTSPVFPSRFHQILAFAMSVDDMAMQLFDKNRSYAAQYQAKYQQLLNNMLDWNVKLTHI